MDTGYLAGDVFQEAHESGHGRNFRCAGKVLRGSRNHVGGLEAPDGFLRRHRSVDLNTNRSTPLNGRPFTPAGETRR